MNVPERLGPQQRSKPRPQAGPTVVPPFQQVSASPTSPFFSIGRQGPHFLFQRVYLHKLCTFMSGPSWFFSQRVRLFRVHHTYPRARDTRRQSSAVNCAAHSDDRGPQCSLSLVSASWLSGQPLSVPSAHFGPRCAAVPRGPKTFLPRAAGARAPKPDRKVNRRESPPGPGDSPPPPPKRIKTLRNPRETLGCNNKTS